MIRSSLKNKTKKGLSCISLINRQFSTTNNGTSTKEVRETFLNYFEKNGHKRLPSGSLLPYNDNTLLFTNAGMVQFKNQFTGSEESKYKKVTTSQKCVRAGGKHNDLDNVGYTARHHTFFEMLGNFSFGGYDHFKRDSIQHAWNLLTKEFGLPKERLAISVLEGDEESAEIWRKQIGLPNDKIMYKGREDNFWSMGDGPGPCGPCSEIFWDHGKEVDGERYLEIWNLVFMQYNKTGNEIGNQMPLDKLPIPCVDTGMGLERMASVLQGKFTNYDIDLFQNLINSFKDIVTMDVGRAQFQLQQDPQRVETAYRVIVDHLRSISFLISDGVIPFNIGRGYVLRKIIRRALSYGKILGFNGPFLSTLFPLLEREMGDVYPQLTERSNEIRNVILNEETTFYNAIQRGTPYLEEMVQQNKLNEESLFLLYNTYGLPLEMSQVKAKQNNIEIDMDKVNKLIDETREQSRLTWNPSGGQTQTVQLPEKTFLSWKSDNIIPKFIGYNGCVENDNAKVIRSHFDNDDHLVYLSLDETSFYGNSGGQVGDIGELINVKSKNVYHVINTIKPYEGGLVLVVEWDPSKQLVSQVNEDLKQDSLLNCRVNCSIRNQVAVHHSATHLLQAALRSVVGKSIVQAGSFVGSESLRFDFTYGQKLTPKQIEQIEQWVNDVIAKDIVLNTDVIPYEQASKDSDAVQLFSEKYSDIVRVVSIPGFSKELCGGTHVERSSAIHQFKIISESSVAAGTRRIEAVAGLAATNFFKSHYQLVQQLSNDINSPVVNFQQSFERLVNTNSKQEKEITELKLKIAQLSSVNYKGQYKADNGDMIPLSLHIIDCEDKKVFTKTTENFAKEFSSSPIQLTISKGGKVLCQSLSPLFSADTVLKQLFKSIGMGKGGGNKLIANASIQPLNDEILNSILNWSNVNQH
ncbi:hypothetical protein RB653_002446 [Dictyostelium firmibasis]|uniref:Alanine--tRNA ligase n=1 Tax=Dictyostelium firmibasis TaxID=79012 RepID=A0AAN7YN10_9MYCE